MVENSHEWMKFKASLLFTTKKDSLLPYGSQKNCVKITKTLEFLRRSREVVTGTGLPESPASECTTMKMSHGNTQSPLPTQPQVVSYPESTGPERVMAGSVGWQPCGIQPATQQHIQDDISMETPSLKHVIDQEFLDVPHSCHQTSKYSTRCQALLQHRKPRPLCRYGLLILHTCEGGLVLNL